MRAALRVLVSGVFAAAIGVLHPGAARAGVDAASDAAPREGGGGGDAAVDSGHGARDAAVDAPRDAHADATRDAHVDAAPDARLDAAREARVEAAADTSVADAGSHDASRPSDASPSCTPVLARCQPGDVCCNGAGCGWGEGQVDGALTCGYALGACLPSGSVCAADSDCCSPRSCTNGVCAYPATDAAACTPVLSACTPGEPCCKGAVCIATKDDAAFKCGYETGLVVDASTPDAGSDAGELVFVLPNNCICDLARTTRTSTAGLLWAAGLLVGAGARRRRRR
jgi:hypothetical protein